jgi:hypothetical protein
VLLSSSSRERRPHVRGQPLLESLCRCQKFTAKIHVTSDSDKGCCYDHDVGIETDDFVWEDALEEICSYENFSVDMTFI